jgi:hypothetical protein
VTDLLGRSSVRRRHCRQADAIGLGRYGRAAGRPRRGRVSPDAASQVRSLRQDYRAKKPNTPNTPGCATNRFVGRDLAVYNDAVSISSSPSIPWVMTKDLFTFGGIPEFDPYGAGAFVCAAYRG